MRNYFTITMRGGYSRNVKSFHQHRTNRVLSEHTQVLYYISHLSNTTCILWDTCNGGQPMKHLHLVRQLHLAQPALQPGLPGGPAVEGAPVVHRHHHEALAGQQVAPELPQTLRRSRISCNFPEG